MIKHSKGSIPKKYITLRKRKKATSSQLRIITLLSLKLSTLDSLECRHLWNTSLTIFPSALSAKPPGRINSFYF